MRNKDRYLDGDGTTGFVDFIYKNGKIEMLDIDNDEKHRKYITYFKLLVCLNHNQIFCFRQVLMSSSALLIACKSKVSERY